MRVLFQEMMLSGPDVFVADAIRKLDLLQRVLKKLVLGIRRPRPRELVFVEAAKLHFSSVAKRAVLNA